ncbi:MAG: hypothetical protein ACK46I_02310 [Phycisphaerae bacterium]
MPSAVNGCGTLCGPSSAAGANTAWLTADQIGDFSTGANAISQFSLVTDVKVEVLGRFDSGATRALEMEVFIPGTGWSATLSSTWQSTSNCSWRFGSRNFATDIDWTPEMLDQIQVRVRRQSGSAGCLRVKAFRVTATFTPAPLCPPNDACTQATPVSIGDTSFSNICRHTSTTPASCLGVSSTADLWYRFVAPETRPYLVDTCDSDFDSMVHVFGACGSVPLACGDDECELLGGGALRFYATAGTAYLVRVSSYADPLGAVGGFGTLRISPQCVPNDACAGAVDISTGATPVINTCAHWDDTLEQCGGLFSTSDLWYRFTAPETRSYQIDICDTEFDAMLHVYNGCGGSPVACADDECEPRGGGRLVLQASAGTSYLIRVSEYVDPEFGTLGGEAVLQIQPVCAANDSCGGAAPIGLGATAFDTTCVHQLETTQFCEGFESTADLWYRFVAPQTRQYVIDLCDVNFDAMLHVFTSCQGAPIACGDDECGIGRGGVINLSTLGGQTYYIRVSGYVGDVGTGTISIGQCDLTDFNRNGIFPEDQDVVDFLTVLAGGDPDTCDVVLGCSDIDFNNNGVFPEERDIIDFFNVLAGGACP